MDCLSSALFYASKNVSVIPIGRDKKPLVRWQEYQDRRATPEEIQQWWQKTPDANVGIVTGKISEMTVVDVEAGGDISKLPDTTVIRTGGGGWHYYYRYEPGVKNSARILPLTDIRGDGGYVVAPPSIHQSGRAYEVISKKPMVPFPSHLFGVVSERKPVGNWGEILNGIPQGSRNETGTKVIGKLLRAFPRDQWESTAWVMFRQWNQTNDPPLDDRELRSIYNSIAKKEFYSRKEELPEEKAGKVRFITMSHVIKESVHELTTTNSNDVISFGYDFLDDKLTGIFKSDLIVLGGESGTGKTTFATNIIYKSSKKHKCCVFALEDRIVNYGIKALYFEIGKLKKSQGQANYPWNDFRKNCIQDPEYIRWRELAEANLENENIYFADVEQQLNIDVLERLIEQKIDEGIELFLIDHLHYFDLMKGDSTKADYIEQTMVRIKTLQKKTGARIILIVHYKKLEGNKPRIDSFKDSISIPQNADYVINLWRDRGENADQYRTQIICPKSRNPNGEFTCEVDFDPLTNDFKLIDTYFGSPQTIEQVINDLPI